MANKLSDKDLADIATRWLDTALNRRGWSQSELGRRLQTTFPDKKISRHQVRFVLHQTRPWKKSWLRCFSFVLEEPLPPELGVQGGYQQQQDDKLKQWREHAALVRAAIPALSDDQRKREIFADRIRDEFAASPLPREEWLELIVEILRGPADEEPSDEGAHRRNHGVG